MIGLNSRLGRGQFGRRCLPFPPLYARPPPRPLPPRCTDLKPITKWPPVTVSAVDLYDFTEKEGTVNSPTEQGAVRMGTDKMCNNQFLMASFNPFSAKCGQRQVSTKFPNFIFQNCEKQIALCESTGRELSFEWSHHRISSTDSKVRVTLQNSIKHSGSERVKYRVNSPNGHSRSGQLYLRPPSQNPILLNSETNSVFSHSRKRPAPVTDTFFATRGYPPYRGCLLMTAFTATLRSKECLIRNDRDY